MHGAAGCPAFADGARLVGGAGGDGVGREIPMPVATM